MDLLVGDLHMKYADGKFDNHGWIWLYRRTGRTKGQASGTQGLVK
jgi:hypothetical protein